MYKKLIFTFLIGISIYHLVHTALIYGSGLVAYSVFSFMKDLLRACVVGIGIWLLRSEIKSFFVLWQKEIILFVALLSRSVVLSVLQGRGADSILIGFKYDLYPLLILLSAAFLGHGLAHTIPPLRLSWIAGLYRTIIIAGLLRQVMKVFLPDLFVRRGYGPVGDYLLGASPPVYYRTGPGGMMRLQGLFAGPNNYGFFLVGITSFLLRFTTAAKKSGTYYLSMLVFTVSLVRTFSRGARVGVLAQVGAFFLRTYPRLRKKVLRAGGGAFIGIVAFSIFKGGSSWGHIQALIDGRHAFVLQPRGYGLGMAGPSVHRAGVYLPENHYLQLLLDIGIIGCALRISFFRHLGTKIRTAVKQHGLKHTSALVALSMGIVGLLIEGLFLHVFEDSMVNYLLLVPFGLLLGAVLRSSIQVRDLEIS